MRAFLVSLAAAFDATKLITGSCTNTFPALDAQCVGTTHGSFDADQATSSITDAATCADYINTHCNTDGEKAVFFSFSPGSFTGIPGGTGICSWWTADQCPCFESKNCAAPTNSAGEKVTGVNTGNIKEYLADNGDGIAPPAGDAPTDTETVVDPNLAGGIAGDMTEDAEEAEGAKLTTIPSAGGIVEGEPAKQQEIGEKDGEFQNGCPTGFRANDIAANRKEWPCVAANVGGLKTGALGGMVVGSIGAGLVAAIFVHWRGNKMRKKAGGGDEGAAAEQDSDA